MADLQEEPMEIVPYWRLGKAAAAEPVFISVLQQFVQMGHQRNKYSKDPITQNKSRLGFLISRDIEMDTKIR